VAEQIPPISAFAAAEKPAAVVAPRSALEQPVKRAAVLDVEAISARPIHHREWIANNKAACKAGGLGTFGIDSPRISG
jgi:hypothetical protein